MNIGTVSHATMREQDLIPCFISEAQSQKLSRADRKELRKITSRVNRARGKDDAYYKGESASFDLETLFEILDRCAPTYFYFGAHPGDGSDFGYWLSEGFEEEFDGLKVSDLAEVPRAHSGEVLLVNDHGNMTLFIYSRGRAREVWAIV